MAWKKEHIYLVVLFLIINVGYIGLLSLSVADQNSQDSSQRTVTNRTLSSSNNNYKYDSYIIFGHDMAKLEVDFRVLEGCPVDIYLISNEEEIKYHKGNDFIPILAFENTTKVHFTFTCDDKHYNLIVDNWDNARLFDTTPEGNVTYYLEYSEDHTVNFFFYYYFRPMLVSVAVIIPIYWLHKIIKKRQADGFASDNMGSLSSRNNAVRGTKNKSMEKINAALANIADHDENQPNFPSYIPPPIDPSGSVSQDQDNISNRRSNLTNHKQ